MLSFLKRYALLALVPVQLGWNVVPGVDGYKLTICPPGGPQRVCEVYDTGTATSITVQVDDTQQQAFLVQSYTGAVVSEYSDPPVLRPTNVSVSVPPQDCTKPLAQCQRQLERAQKLGEELTQAIPPLRQVTEWIGNRGKNHVLRPVQEMLEQHTKRLERLGDVLKGGE